MQSATLEIYNNFIDRYIKDTNGNDIKVYLYLLRHLDNNNSSLTISDIADNIDFTEKEVIKALLFWQDENLITLDYSPEGILVNIKLTDSIAKESEIEYTAVSLESFDKDSNIKNLLVVCSSLIGKPLSVKQTSFIIYWYDELKLSPELIYHLLEYCIKNNHESFDYMNAVAFNWKADNITTVDEAIASSQNYNQTIAAVKKALGISNRDFIDSEIEYINKWQHTYGMSLDIICEACSKTIIQISRPSFKYVDSILSSWNELNVKSVEDIKNLDKAYAREYTKDKEKPKNKFHNFAQRNYDFEELENKLLGRKPVE